MRRGTVALLVALLLLGTGCWDARPIEQRAFVVMMGIDRTPEEQFRVSLQLQRAGYEQQGAGARSKAPTSQVLVNEAPTPRQALERVRDDLGRELDTTFLELTVISREVAEKHLEDLDWIVRAFRVPVSGYLAVAPTDAESVVRARALGFGMPAQLALFGLLGGGWTRSPAIVEGRMWMIFNRHFYTPLEDAYAPILIRRDDGKLNWHGLAVFRQRRLAGLLSETDAVHLNLLLGGRSQSVVAAKVPNRQGAQASFYLQSVDVKRKVIWQGDRPVIQVRILTRGILQELIGMRLWGEADEQAVENALAEKLATEVKELIRRLQDLGSDPVGFGELARQRAPYRREVSSGDAWREAYRRAHVDVVVTMRMVATGYMK